MAWAMSVHGTNRTNGAGLAMSVDRGIAEVAFQGCQVRVCAMTRGGHPAHLRQLQFRERAVELLAAPNLFVVRTARCNLFNMHDLQEMAEKLLEAARKLPPGSRRHEMLKEIGRFRARINALLSPK